MIFAPLLAIMAVSVARPSAAATLRLGEEGANVVFAFNVHTRPRAIVLRTKRVGVAGSRIVVTVDQVKKPVFSHIFSPGECKFGSSGSICEVVIPAKAAAYHAILTWFKRGRQARVTVLDAGVMKMDQTVSLRGFVNALH